MRLVFAPRPSVFRPQARQLVKPTLSISLRMQAGLITTAPQQENEGREAMADRPFRNPLLAKLDDTSHYTVRSAWEALEYLQRYWPGPQDNSYKILVHLCRDAVDGWIPAERAREGLKHALDTAGLAIPKPRRSPRKNRVSHFKRAVAIINASIDPPQTGGLNHG